MEKIVVTKRKLIDIMEKNREQHHRIVIEAQAGFRAKAIERLDEMLQLAARGEEIQLLVGLRVPEDHTDEYDTVLGMLSLDINETVELTYQQYQQWVEDHWGWTASFTSSNSMYSETARKL